MTSREFFHKFNSTYVWGNILAIVILVLMLAIGVRFGLDFYTHHGESIVVPDVIHKQYDEAVDIMDKVGLTIEVTDTGYVKNLPPDCILEQSLPVRRRSSFPTSSTTIRSVRRRHSCSRWASR